MKKLKFTDFLIKLNKELSQVQSLIGKPLSEYSVLDCNNIEEVIEKLESIGFVDPKTFIIGALVDLK